MNLNYLNPGAFAIIWFIVSSIGIMINWRAHFLKAILLVFINAVVISACSYCYNWYEDLDINYCMVLQDEISLEISDGMPVGSKCLQDTEITRDRVHVAFVISFFVALIYGFYGCYRDNGNKGCKHFINLCMISYRDFW